MKNRKAYAIALNTRDKEGREFLLVCIVDEDKEGLTERQAIAEAILVQINRQPGLAVYGVTATEIPLEKWMKEDREQTGITSLTPPDVVTAAIQPEKPFFPWPGEWQTSRDKSTWGRFIVTEANPNTRTLRPWSYDPMTSQNLLAAGHRFWRVVDVTGQYRAAEELLP